MTARIVSLGGAVVIAVGLAILAWPQTLGLERAFPVALLVSLRGVVAILAVVLAVPFAVLTARSRNARPFAAAVTMLLVVFAAVNVAVLSGRGTGGGPDGGDAASVTVLSWNTLGDAPGAEVIARLAIDSGADIVALPETTRATGLAVGAIMSAAGMPMQAFTVAYDETSTARSTTLLVSEALGEYSVDEEAMTTLVLPTVVARPVDGTGPTLLAAHTLAPIPPMMLAWQDDLAWVAAACSGDDLIVAGDFNATVDHFAGLAHTDGGTLGRCADAATAAGSAGEGTWPVALPPLLSSPIDHVLATPNWRVTGFRVIQSHDGYGSDHRPVLAQLSPAG